MRDFARDLVLPLIVTLLLQHDGHYQLSEDDEARCQAVDKLLAVAGWDEEDDGGPARWQTTLTDLRTRLHWDRIHQRIFAQHPELVGDDGDAAPREQ